MLTPDLSVLLGALVEAGFPIADAVPMTGDVSQRRYFRVSFEGPAATAVLALYPAALRTAAWRYQRATTLFAAAGLPVPAILASAQDLSWMLTEDFGPATLFDLHERPFAEIEPYFLAAVEGIGRIEELDRRAVGGLNPPLDAALLRRELAMTQRVFFEPRGLPFDPELALALDRLCERLGHERRVPCHRDLGVRNLLPRPGQRVGFVDHQDLRLGPAGYDLASLLNDSLFPPPEAEERLLAAAGCTDRELYHRAAAQRTLKAIGSYAAFAARSPRYLPLVAPTLGRAIRHLGQTPETADLAPRMADDWRSVVGDGAAG